MAKNGNKWILNNLLKIVLVIAGLVAAGAVIREAIADMKPRLKQAEDDIVELEKADIGIKGSVDALKVQQEAYHTESDEKLDQIIKKLDEK